MYKYMHYDNEGINLDLTKHKEKHNYNTRNKEDLLLPKPRTNQLKRSFEYSAISTWNSLPPNIKSPHNLITFKKLLKQSN
jgi:hypothetical protein